MSSLLRRCVAGAAVTLIALAPAAGAGESVPAGQRWGGSSVAPPEPITDPTLRTTSITGTLRDRGGLVGRPAMAASVTTPAGCPEIPDVALSLGGGSITDRRSFSGSGPFPEGACNGTFRVAILIEGTERMDTQLVVDLPAPVVTTVAAVPSSDGRSITVTWDDARPLAPDLEGYVVERQVDGDDPAQVAALGADVTRFVDDDLPSDGGAATYRVMSQRPSPGGTTVSAVSSSEPTSFQPRPAGDPDPSPGGGGPGSAPGDGGTGSEPGDGGTGSEPGDPTAPGGEPGDPAAPGSGLGDGRDRPRQRVSPPRVGFSRSFLPPLLSPRVSPDQAGRSSTTTSIDDGYDEDLPYNPVDGPPEAEAPDDELAGFFTSEVAGRGMAIPVATALVLAGWALHLRVLARASRPYA